MVIPGYIHRKLDRFRELSCLLFLSGGQTEQVTAFQPDYSSLYQQLVAHHLTIQASQICEDDEASAPDWFCKKINKKNRAISQHMLGFTSVFLNLSKLLTNHGYSHLSIKGPVLSQQLNGYPGQRHARDLDLLIKPEDIYNIYNLMKKNGYRPFYPAKGTLSRQMITRNQNINFISEKEHVPVEIHWRLFANKKFCDFSWDELAHNTATVKIGNNKVRTLNNTYNLLYLCSHACLHQWNNLLWLNDIVNFRQTLPVNNELLHALTVEQGLEEIIAITNALLLISTNHQEHMLILPSHFLPTTKTWQMVSTILKNIAHPPDHNLYRKIIKTTYLTGLKKARAYKTSCYSLRFKRMFG